jgi:hypothetical protein
MQQVGRANAVADTLLNRDSITGEAIYLPFRIRR